MCDRAVQAAIQLSVSCASRGWRVISDEQKTTKGPIQCLHPSHSSSPARVRNPSACWPSWRLAGAGARYLRRGLRGARLRPWALVQNGPEERLNQTDKTQPAILTVSIAPGASGWPRAVRAQRSSPGTAWANIPLVAAESLAFADAVSWSSVGAN